MKRQDGIGFIKIFSEFLSLNHPLKISWSLKMTLNVVKLFFLVCVYVSVCVWVCVCFVRFFLYTFFHYLYVEKLIKFRYQIWNLTITKFCGSKISVVEEFNLLKNRSVIVLWNKKQITFRFRNQHLTGLFQRQL